LSYLPGDQPYGLTSFSSDTVIASIRSVPEKKFSDAYARSYLNYKDFVETDYSHNYIQSSFKVKVFKSSGQFFIHWSCEPEKVSFAQQNETYSASFELILRMEDLEGNLVLEKEEEIPLKLNAEQYKKHERQRFAFQNILPAIPGKYKIFVLLKNKTAKDFSSFDTEVSVPEEGGSPLVSNLLLYQVREKVSEAQKNNLKAFSFAASQYLFNTRNEFTPQGELGCYLQTYNFQGKPENSVVSVLFEINSLDLKSVVMSQKKPLDEVLCSDREGMDIGPFSLSTLKPGYFEVEVSLLDAGGRKLLSGKEGFVLLAQPYLVLPWVYSKLYSSFPNSEGLYFLSSQYFMVQKYEKAKSLLEQALKLRDEPRTRLLLAKSLFALNQYQDSLTLVVPVYQASHNREAAKVIALDYTGLKDWSSALIYLNKLLEEATEVSVLNLAADCYLNLNQPEKALPLIQKSLELNPAQPAVKQMEEKAKKHLKNSHC
jgi:tetratricopeptide (TPR) repeat protein